MIQVGKVEWLILRTIHDAAGQRVLTADLIVRLVPIGGPEIIFAALWGLLMNGLIGFDQESQSTYLMNNGSLACRNIGVDDYPVMVPVNARFIEDI